MNLSSGFSLLEIVLVLSLVGVLGVILFYRPGGKSKVLSERFVERINDLVVTARVNAVVTGKPHRVFFDFKKKFFWIEVLADVRVGEVAKFVKLSIPYVRTVYPIDDSLSLENVDIGDRNSAKSGQERIVDAFFVISPAGLLQEANLCFLNDDFRFCIKSSPFKARFLYV